MDPKTLRVRVRGDALVQDYERQAAGVNAFVGRKFAELEPGRWGFVPTGDDAEVPFRAEYVKALKDGDLLPADEASAKAAGLTFTPRPTPIAFRDLSKGRDS